MKNTVVFLGSSDGGSGAGRPWLPVALFIAALLTLSCGGVSDKAPTEQTAAAKQALTCSADLLAVPPGTPASEQLCGGPWEHTLYADPCWRLRVDNSCEIVAYEQYDCTPYPQCTIPQNFTAMDQNFVLTGPTNCKPGTNLCLTLPPTQEQCQLFAAGKAATILRVQSYSGTLGTKIGLTQANCRVRVVAQRDVVVQGPQCDPNNTIPKQFCDDPNRPIHGACRTPWDESTNQPNTQEPKQCGEAPGLNYSEPGLQRSALPELAVKESARCFTCDELPVGTAEEVNAKGNCLFNAYYNSSSLPESAAPETVKNQVVSRLKLLLETKGQLLEPTARDGIVTLYASEPSAVFDCDGGSTFTPPSVPETCDPGAISQLNSGLAFCERLLRPHVSSESAEGTARSCVELALPLTALGLDCGRDAYQARYLEIVPAVVQKGVSGSTVGDRTSVIQSRLRLIARMYEAMRPLELGTPQETAARQVIGAFWKGLLGPETEKLRGDSSRLKEVFDAQFAVDREVLSAAFSPGPTEGVMCTHLVSVAGAPLTQSCDPCVAYTCERDPWCCNVWWDSACVYHDGVEHWCSAGVSPSEFQPPMSSPVLLYVVADALTSLFNRLEDVSLVHDFGCRFKTSPGSDSACRGGGVVSSTSALWQALAAVPDSAKLSTALGVSALDPQWRPVFQAISSQHGALEAAVIGAFGAAVYDPALLGGGTPSTPPPSAIALTNLLVTAQSRSARYAATGLFEAEADLLRGGLQDSRFSLIQAEINAQTAQLGTAVTNYDAGLNGLVSALVAAADGTQAEALINSKLAVNLREFSTLSDQFVGLQTANTFDERRFGDFMKAFERLNSSGAVDPNALMLKGNRSNLSIPAGAARFTSSSQDIGAIAVVNNGAVWKLDASAGDMVNVEVSGNWAPTCALRNAMAPNGQPYGVTAALTGPEGYSVRVDNGSYSSSATSDTDTKDKYLDISASVKACAGPDGFWGSAQVCAEVAAGIKWSDTHSESTSSGADSRTTASFGAGLRLPNTAFPSMPAGALLLVQMTRGETSKNRVIEVNVLRGPSTSVLVSHDADLYLVVNDKAGCSVLGDALTVAIQPLQPQAATARQVSLAMSGVYDSVRARGRLAAQRGVLTPTEIAAMRDEAFGQLTAACGCDFSTYPAPLREFFGVWINNELVAVERQVAMFKMQKDMEIALLQRDALTSELSSEQNKRHLQALLPAWSMRSVDADALRDTLHPLLSTLTEEFFPFLLLRYPSALVHGSDALRRIDALLSATWSTPTVELADRTSKAAAALMTEAAASVRDNPPTEKSDVLVLNYVRPGDQPSTGSVWRMASPERAEVAWSAINEQTSSVASFAVQPEDLYSLTGGAAVLTCSDSAPVITSAAVYVPILDSTLGERLSSQNWVVPASFATVHTFPTAAGVTSFRFSDAWLSQGLPVLFGQNGAAVDVFRRFVGTTGNVAEGLSPFASLDVNLEALNVLSEGVNLAPGTGASVNEMLLVLQVEARPIGARVAGVSTCR